MFVADPNDTEETAESEEETPADTEETPGDSEEASDESEDGKEGEEEEDTTDEESNETTLGFDPNKLTPDLKVVFKKMQANHTRAMQEVHGIRKQAAAFQALIENPETRALIFGKGEGSDKPDEEEVVDTDSASASVRKIFRDEMEKYFGPIAKDLKETKAQAERAKLDHKYRAEFAEFTKNRPDWEVYKEEMKIEMDDDPNMTYEKAYRIVAFPQAETNGHRSAMKKLETKKRLNVSRPGKAVGETEPKQAKTVEEAFHIATRQLKKQGKWKE